MSITDFVNLGVAAVIAWQINRKMDVFIGEFKHTNASMTKVLGVLMATQDDQGERLAHIETFLAGEQETEIKGFTGT